MLGRWCVIHRAYVCCHLRVCSSEGCDRRRQLTNTAALDTFLFVHQLVKHWTSRYHSCGKEEGGGRKQYGGEARETSKERVPTGCQKDCDRKEEEEKSPGCEHAARKVVEK